MRFPSINHPNRGPRAPITRSDYALRGPILSGPTGGNAWETVVDETVTGAAAAELSSGTIALTDNQLYYFEAHITNASSLQRSFQLQFNGNSTSSAYRRGRYYSSGTNSDDSAYAIVTISGLNEAIISGYINEMDGGESTVSYWANTNNATARLGLNTQFIPTVGAITELSVNHATSSFLDIGTRLIIKRRK